MRVFSAMLLLLSLSLSSNAQSAPATECSARVNYDLNMELPGYLVQDSAAAGKVCVPFSYRLRQTPVAEFSDARIKAKYEACKRDRACSEKLAGIAPLVKVPNEFRVTGTVDAAGKIDPHGVVDLRKIRRPAYFGKAPYQEPIAEAEPRTSVIELQVPREAWEQRKLSRTDPLALCGWYLEGAGVDDGKGGRIRALAVLIAGRSVETTALQAPEERAYDYDAKKGHAVARTFPNARTEKMGSRGWRNVLYEMNRAGFDVLTFDKRGHGISGGYNDVNTLEQGRDMWRALDALETGKGVRALTPSGKLIEGAAVRGQFLAGMKAKQVPVIFGGSSQGSIATAWAMHQNLVEDCTWDLPAVRCSPPHRYNVKGALLMATVLGGVGTRPVPFDIESGVLDEGRARVEQNVVMLPSSEPLAHIDRWPAVFFAKGLWDFAESLEDTLEAYQRVKGAKELVVVRGPHPEIEFGTDNSAHVHKRMVAFSRAAVLGQREVPGAARFDDLRALVASSPAYWEPSSDPRAAPVK